MSLFLLFLFLLLFYFGSQFCISSDVRLLFWGGFSELRWFWRVRTERENLGILEEELRGAPRLILFLAGSLILVIILISSSLFVWRSRCIFFHFFFLMWCLNMYGMLWWLLKAGDPSLVIANDSFFLFLMIWCLYSFLTRWQEVVETPSNNKNYRFAN